MEDTLGSKLIGTLLFGGLYLLGRACGKQDAYREIKEKCQEAEATQLRKEVDDLNIWRSRY